MEEMIRRAYNMEELMDYDSISLFPNARLPSKFKMPTLDKFDGIGSPKSPDHFLLTIMDKPCRSDQCNVHYITSCEV